MLLPEEREKVYNRERKRTERIFFLLQQWNSTILSPQGKERVKDKEERERERWKVEKDRQTDGACLFTFSLGHWEMEEGLVAEAAVVSETAADV